jgi:hypothetical protein
MPSISPGYGFAAIIVAFVGRLHPAGILFASLLMSLLYLGGESAQIGRLPSAVTGLFRARCFSFCSPPTCSSITGCACSVLRRRAPRGRDGPLAVARADSGRRHRLCSRRWASSSPKNPVC